MFERTIMFNPICFGCGDTQIIKDIEDNGKYFTVVFACPNECLNNQDARIIPADQEDMRWSIENSEIRFTNRPRIFKIPNGTTEINPQTGRKLFTPQIMFSRKPPEPLPEEPCESDFDSDDYWPEDD